MVEAAPRDSMSNLLPQTEWQYLTRHEMSYLLSLDDSDSARMSSNRLNLPADDGSNPVGAATLVVRGLASVADDLVLPESHAAVTSWILSTAFEWIEIGVLADRTQDALLLVTNEDAAVMLGEGPLGIFRIALAPNGEDMRRFAASFIAGTLAESHSDDQTVSVRRVTLSTNESLGIHCGATGWELAAPLPGSGRDQAALVQVTAPYSASREDALRCMEAVLGLSTVDIKA